MTTSVIGIILAAAGSVGAYFTWKNSAFRQRQLVEKQVDKEEEEHANAKAEIEAAVYGRDDAKVNQIVSNLLAPVLCLCVLSSVVGCSTSKPSVVYVPSDRRIESITNSFGVACKAVPDPVFAEMLVKITELENLKKERKVDARLSTTKN